MPVKEIFKMDFLEEKVFDREQYDTYIRRIHYDDRMAVMYEESSISFSLILWKNEGWKIVWD